MGRIRKRSRRRSGVKDPNLFVIACEGARTEPEYFEELTSHPDYRNPKVHVVLLARKEPGESAPLQVISQLNAYRRDLRLNKGDQLWMVIDLDRWTHDQLNQVAAECANNEYHLAVSNPCFELWLLLHFKDLTALEAEELRRICCGKDSLKENIRECVASFAETSDVTISVFMPHVGRAITRAKRIDKQTQTRWPETIGTRVYLLVEQIIST